MNSVFITTTSTEGLKPLGTTPERSFELVTRPLNEEQAALFAEPVHSDYGDTVDWYSVMPGKVQPLSKLEDEAQAAVRKRLAILVSEIRELAESFAANQQDLDSMRLGDALGNALQFPNDDSIFARIDPDGSLQPILVNWAWVEDRQGAIRSVLSGTDGRASAAATAASASEGASTTASGAEAVAAASARDERAARQGRAMAVTPIVWWWLFGLGWLILALLIALILLLLIAPCALRLPGLNSHCTVGVAEVSADERRTAVLRNQVAYLERQIAIADRACQPEPERPDFLPFPRVAAPPVPPVVRPEVTDHDAIDDRLERAGAQVGDLTFSLVWDGPDDLDLEVTCPSGERLFWGVRTGCRGRVDIDTGVGSAALEPVENIFFQSPVPGDYSISVTMPTSRRQGAPQSFQLLVRDGAKLQVLEGVVSGRERQWTQTYRFGVN